MQKMKLPELFTGNRWKVGKEIHKLYKRNYAMQKM